MASPPSTTIVPFADLPSCATDCAPLLAANGACVPPTVPAVDESCFCAHGALSAFRTGTKGVCDDICGGGDKAKKALVEIQNWFAETCNVKKVAASEGSSKSGSSSGDDGGSGTHPWVQMHWRWLVAIIVMAVAIVVIWVGAFWWRRRHLRKKELKRSLGKNPERASWGPGAAPPPGVAGPGVFGTPGSGTPEPGKLG